jgi:hypothetical protein
VSRPPPRPACPGSIRANALDAPEVELRLAGSLSKMLSELAARLVADEHAVVPAARFNLDTLTPVDRAFPPEHWAFAVREMHLTQAQVRARGLGAWGG